jgi:sugar lactone lactonase YvrE
MRWFIAVAVLAIMSSAASASSRVTIELPYDLVVARNGTIFVADGSRILSVQPRTGRVRVVRRVPGTSEIAGLARLEDGTVFVADLPSGRIQRVPPKGAVTTVATIDMPVDLLADPAADVLWVASIADGVGLVRVDLATGTVAPFAPVVKPHGLDRLPGGDLAVHDGHRVSRVDSVTGAVTRLASVDAVKLAAAPDGVVYGAAGSPKGGRVVRISPGGAVKAIAGTGKLGPQRDGRALHAPMLPSALAIAPDGSLVVAQIEPVPAIRRLDLRRGTIRTIALGG